MRFQTLYEGRWIFAIVIALGVIGGALGWLWLVILSALLVLFCINFFRDPDHAIIDTKMDHSLEVGKAGSVRYHVPPK